MTHYIAPGVTLLIGLELSCGALGANRKNPPDDFWKTDNYLGSGYYGANSMWIPASAPSLLGSPA